MATIVHLSDLHLFANRDQEREVLDPLVDTLARVRTERGRAVDLLVVTGDVFDSADADPRVVVREFADLHVRIDAALGPSVPTVVVPGNHDRRRRGFIGRHRAELFRALREAAIPRVFVGGCDTPFLADVVPEAFHGLPLCLVAYDSTYVARGLVGAGGLVRQEDLLQVADEIADQPADRPLVLLLHHHLIPTPLTDLAHVDTHEGAGAVDWVVQQALPTLFAHAEREELMMTALGAGTALSTLHTLGRPVLVLHGHKHYPVVRVLRGIAAGHADVMVASAGSAGVLQRWSPTTHRDAARLWPSFNVVDVDADGVRIDAVAFGPRASGSASIASRVTSRALARARRDGLAWAVDGVDDEPARAGPRLALNDAAYEVVAGDDPQGRWDVLAERAVHAAPGVAISEYVEALEGVPGSRLVDVTKGDERRPERLVPAELHLPTDGTPVRYRHLGGVCRTIDDAVSVYEQGTAPFEWVGLLNRYPSGLARLVLRGLPAGARAAFGSATDLTTGRERPVRVAREAGRVAIEYPDCPPRTLLRIYWPLV